MKRIISIVLALSVLLFSISSFASSDGGLILKNWYDRAIGQAAEEAATELASGMIIQKSKVSRAKSDRLFEAVRELNIFSSYISENTVEEVLNYQKHYVMKTKATEEALRKKNFSSFKNEETVNLESELENDAAEILADVLQ